MTTPPTARTITRTESSAANEPSERHAHSAYVAARLDQQRGSERNSAVLGRADKVHASSLGCSIPCRLARETTHLRAEFGIRARASRHLTTALSEESGGERDHVPRSRLPPLHGTLLASVDVAPA